MGRLWIASSLTSGSMGKPPSCCKSSMTGSSSAARSLLSSAASAATVTSIRRPRSVAAWLRELSALLLSTVKMLQSMEQKATGSGSVTVSLLMSPVMGSAFSTATGPSFSSTAVRWGSLLNASSLLPSSALRSTARVAR